jgi:hypothetical protein
MEDKVYNYNRVDNNNTQAYVVCFLLLKKKFNIRIVPFYFYYLKLCSLIFIALLFKLITNAQSINEINTQKLTFAKITL